MPRILTYNVRRCLGTDGRISPGRIADVIAAYEPDIVALQELDVGRARTGGVDQAHVIAQALGMRMHFHPSLRVLEEEYGNAILTHRPSQLIKSGPLPNPAGRFPPEPRGALWASIDFEGIHLQVITTHLGLRPGERLTQVDCLLGSHWIGGESCREPLIMLGDFNTSPRSRAYRRLTASLRDAQIAAPYHKVSPTFPSRLPLLRIDHVFVSHSVRVTRVEVPRTPMARVASDHLPLMVEFQLIPAAAHEVGLETARE